MPLRIISYQSSQGMSGKLKGKLTLTDGRTYAVWDDELHQQCKELARERVTPVLITSSTSERWGHSLRSITRAAAYVDAYDQAREADEQRGRLKPNSWMGRRIGQGVR